MEYQLTLEKKQELEIELVERKTVLRDQIGERVATARALGDLSENAEYHAARNEQGKNESRIIEIESILKHAHIITKSDSGIVELGSTVIVKKDDEEKTFMIVSDVEADISIGKLSIGSPIGAAMMGKKIGDTFTVITPRGETHYTIMDIT
jgi:transcription elongation factor GreA